MSLWFTLSPTFTLTYSLFHILTYHCPILVSHSHERTYSHSPFLTCPHYLTNSPILYRCLTHTFYTFSYVFYSSLTHSYPIIIFHPNSFMYLPLLQNLLLFRISLLSLSLLTLTATATTFVTNYQMFKSSGKSI